jgi:NADPH:quinone reductase-like Zn-dependent oxidoreductase
MILVPLVRPMTVQPVRTAIGAFLFADRCTGGAGDPPSSTTRSVALHRSSSTCAAAGRTGLAFEAAAEQSGSQSDSDDVIRSNRRSKSMGASATAMYWLDKRIVAVLSAILAGSAGVIPAATYAADETMSAILYHEYGTAEVLRLEQAARPAADENRVVIKVRAAGANPLDWHYMRGTPYIMRMESGLSEPKSPRLGVDVAGEVVAVGPDVTRFKPGDEVFGAADGAFAEYARAREKNLVLKPPGVSYEQAGGVAVAALTALQGLRDKGRLQAGQRVLINGASGGVGTFAVQIAKALGAHVTGVCSTRNLELVRSLGADHVFDYTQDLILDNVGNRDLSDLKRVMAPDGVAVLIGGGGPDAGNWVGPLARPAKALLYSPFVSQSFEPFLATINAEDLGIVADMMAQSKVQTVIDRTYSLQEVPEAIRYLESGRARGKVIITVHGDGPSD